MSTITINGLELSIDLLDADTMERYQNALNKTISEIKHISSSLPSGAELHIAESMKRQCRIIEKFVDEIFGDGASDRCFHGNNHLGEHLEAFTEICNQASLAVNQTKSIINKYSGERVMNRQQRREHKNHNNTYPIRP